MEELCVDLENNWHKGTTNFPYTSNEAYTLLKTFRSGTKFVSNIIEKSKQNNRSDDTPIQIQRQNRVFASTKKIPALKAVNNTPMIAVKR